MEEYIEREDALELLEQPITMSMCLTVGECASKRNQRLIDCALIKSIPAADVVPVVHGEWRWTETGEADYEQFWVCSVCGEKSYWKSNYCENCGAKMDGEHIAKRPVSEAEREHLARRTGLLEEMMD